MTTLPGGLFLISCPWHLLYSPDVAEVAEAYEWSTLSMLDQWWGGSPPIVLLRAITLYSRGRNKGERDAFELRRQEREKNRK